eukprot:2586660-Rhodomonas_salina.4
MSGTGTAFATRSQERRNNLALERVGALAEGSGLGFLGFDVVDECIDLGVEVDLLLLHLGLRHLQLLLQLLELLLGLLRVLDQEEIAFFEPREDVEELLRPREVHWNLLPRNATQRAHQHVEPSGGVGRGFCERRMATAETRRAHALAQAHEPAK